MKKIISILIFAGLAVATGAASAAATAITSGTPIDTTACSLLRDRVTVNLSSGVVAAYNCDTTDNMIGVAACHTAGSQKPQTIECASTPDAQGNPVWNDASCPAVATDPPATFTIQGRRVFTGSSAGGNVAAGNLDSDTCNQSALAGQAIME
ncbi:hypothetical protein [Azoarcus sp. DD4]|uniref:hypothetical protein n=1 Tax=Azoarcus sp. DD4 TaxID=2027405 RepID=UPI00112BEA31|nr:hypothetical protein [Azoarcus sp. DD4]